MNIINIIIGTAHAQGPSYQGGGIWEGIKVAAEAAGIILSTPDEILGNILSTIISFVAIAGVFTITIAGFYLILGLGSDDSRIKAKKIVLYTVSGIVLIGLANAIVNFSLSIVNGSGDGGLLYSVIEHILSIALGYVGLLAVTAIVVAGFYLILGLGSDESRKTARNIVLYTTVGIVIIGLAGAIVNFAGALVGENFGDTEPIREAITAILTTVLSYVALLATTTIVIAGFYLMLGLGSEQSQTTARKIITYTIAGIIIMGLASAIVNVVVGSIS